MIEWCTNFIADGFWRAVLFMLVFNLICSIPRFIFKNALIKSVFSFGPNIVSCLIIWSVRDGTGWLVLGIISIIGLLVSAIIAVFAKSYKITDENIASYAEGYNSNFPKNVNNTIRCEGVRTMHSKIWIYRMTILDVADISQVTANLNSAVTRQNILNNIKTAADMKVFRDSDVSIYYEYSDETGNVFNTLKFTPSDYKA